MADDYLFDIFISYRRTPLVSGWLKNHFFPMLEQWLPHYLPVDKQVDIFVDWKIETGAAWPQSLRQALSKSRCLLPIWSPEYFRSEWCLAEWHTMREREKLLNMQNDENPIGLTYPVVFADGEHFPEQAKTVQQKRDLRNWNCPYEVLRETKGIIEFDREVQVVAQELAGMLARTPKWSSEWPIVTPETISKITMSLPRL